MLLAAIDFERLRLDLELKMLILGASKPIRRACSIIP